MSFWSLILSLQNFAQAVLENPLMFNLNMTFIFCSLRIIPAQCQNIILRISHLDQEAAAVDTYRGAKSKKVSVLSNATLWTKVSYVSTSDKAFLT